MKLSCTCITVFFVWEHLKFAMDCIFYTMNVASVEFSEINCEYVCGLFGIEPKFKFFQVLSRLFNRSHFHTHPPHQSAGHDIYLVSSGMRTL